MPVADPPLTLATCLLRERLTGNFGCDSDDKKVICDEEPMLLGLDDECASLMKVRSDYRGNMYEMYKYCYDYGPTGGLTKRCIGMRVRNRA